MGLTAAQNTLERQNGMTHRTMVAGKRHVKSNAMAQVFTSFQ